MISILIPVYNYSITGLVKELKNQAEELKQPFEILVLDDCSSDQETTKENQRFCEGNSVEYIISKNNLGNAKARKYLVECAKFDWLLFIDADMMPVEKKFFYNFSNAVSFDKKVICSNVVYREEKPINGILRWKYGERYEEASIEERKENPYSTFRLACFMIHKSLFIYDLFPIQKEDYGYTDLVFATNLKKIGVEPFHIQNPVYHLGLETNQVFLNKTEKAMRNAAYMVESENVLAEYLKIVSFYQTIRRVYLDRVVCLVFKYMRNKIKRNLLSESPSILLFQFYKLGYLCELLAS